MEHAEPFRLVFLLITLPYEFADFYNGGIDFGCKREAKKAQEFLK